MTEKGIISEQISIMSLDKLNEFSVESGNIYNYTIVDIDYLLNAIKSMKSLGAENVVLLVADGLPIMIKDIIGDSGICIAPVSLLEGKEKLLEEQIKKLKL